LTLIKMAGREERSKDVEVELSGGSVRGLALIEMAGRQGRGEDGVMGLGGGPDRLDPAAVIVLEA